jgi:hypothetical protein
MTSVKAKMRERLCRWLDDLVIVLRRSSRPNLKPGDALEVQFQGENFPYWVPHEFVEWADAPSLCCYCSGVRNNPQMIVRSAVPPYIRIVLRYAEPMTIAWRVCSRKVQKLSE